MIRDNNNNTNDTDNTTYDNNTNTCTATTTTDDSTNKNDDDYYNHGRSYSFIYYVIIHDSNLKSLIKVNKDIMPTLLALVALVASESKLKHTVLFHAYKLHTSCSVVYRCY